MAQGLGAHGTPAGRARLAGQMGLVALEAGGRHGHSMGMPVAAQASPSRIRCRWLGMRGALTNRRSSRITSPLRLAWAGSLLALAAGGAVAQSAAATAASSASQPRTAVAVSPGTAAEASQKAIPRSDVGTVVKTGPTVADKVRDATGRDKPHATHRARHPHHAASAASAASAPDGR